jgi:hypothetical protein
VRKQALGLSPGGRTTKIHALTDAQCRPLTFLLIGLIQSFLASKFGRGYTSVTASLLRALSKQFIPVRVHSKAASESVSCISVKLSERS